MKITIKDCGNSYYEIVFSVTTAIELEKLNEVSDHTEYITKFREDVEEFINTEAQQDADNLVIIQGNTIVGDAVEKKLVVKSSNGDLIKFLETYIKL